MKSNSSHNNSRWLAMRCNDAQFRAFLAAKYGKHPKTAQEAAQAVRDIGGVTSRAEFDGDAQEAFHTLFRVPFIKYSQREK